MKIYIEIAAYILEAIGIVIITLGTVVALGKFGFRLGDQKDRSYRLLRHEIGRVILLGLEILVGADIVATVVTEPTMSKVLTLGLIVLIRTFLSLSLQVELEGRFPWQKKKAQKK